jgi:hypothetical protein
MLRIACRTALPAQQLLIAWLPFSSFGCSASSCTCNTHRLWGSGSSNACMSVLSTSRQTNLYGLACAAVLPVATAAVATAMASLG